jgi:type I restriction enzyme S subunit
MPENIGDNRILSDEIARITSQDAERLSRYRVRCGDIVYSRRGDVERRALVRSTEDGWLCGTGCLRVRVGDGVLHPSFTAYYLGHPEVRNWIVRHAVGATMPNLNTAILSALPVVIPPMEEQKRINVLLDALEDKIELNRRMNETVDLIIRNIFRSWFVDFDPVRVKGEVRSPLDTSRDFGTLFPTRFVITEAGKIPYGWEIRAIGDLTTVLGGGTPRTEEAAYWKDGGVPWATPKDLAALDSPVLLDTERHITEEGLQQVSSGLLPKGTVLLSSRAPIGYVAISEVALAINQGFIALVCGGELSSYFVLNWLRENLDRIKAKANGTTFLEISKANFKPLRVVVPPRHLRLAFDRTVGPLYSRITANLRESSTLTELRDILLPKLVSGELRVRNGEQAVGGAL